MKLTYRDLLQRLSELTEEQLGMNVSILNRLEPYELNEIQLFNLTDSILASESNLIDEYDCEPDLPVLVV